VELTSTAFFVVMIVLALALPVGLALLWRRWARTRWGVASLVLGVLLAQAVAVGAVAVGTNRAYGFYPTWDSLLGQQVAPPIVAQGNPLGLGISGNELVARKGYIVPNLRPLPGDGSYREYVIAGARSHITQRVVVWLPPEYSQPKYAKERFPVVMVLSGGYVQVGWLVDHLHFDSIAAPEIRAGRVAPFVAIFPELNVAQPMDTECTDIPGGLQTYTWLAKDVPEWAKTTLRVSPDHRKWSVEGWSTGGYCAAKLHLRNPDVFVAGASVQGYFTPELDHTTGNLQTIFRNHIKVANLNSPLWLAEHRPPGAPHLLVMTSPPDPQSYRESMDFLRRTHNLPGVQPYVVQGVGHSMATWELVTPPILGWLAAVAGA